MTKSIWLLSAGIMALGTSPALAQDQTTPTGETSPTQEAGEVNQEVDVDPNDEIVITAQGRAQILQDVPLAVSAVSAENLQNSGASDIRQLNQLAPSLLVSSTGTEANGSARIRGIGTVGDNPGLESSVAVFIDGVYRSRSGIGLNELGEIERVEVLRGPQGTLFGRNASAGLIHVISKKPNMSEFEGFGELSYGSYDFIRASAGFTGPIGESMGFRLDGVHSRRDGFYEVVNNTGQPTGQRVNNRDRYFVRGQLMFEPNDALEVRLIGDYTERNEACCAAAYRSTVEAFDPTPGAPGDFATRPSRVVNILTNLGGYFPTPNDRFSRQISITPGRDYGGKTRDGGISGQVDYSFGGASLTSITAYRDYKSYQGGDIDYSTVDLLYREPDGTSFRQFKTFTQELRLQGSAFDDKLDWLVGGYFADEKLRLRDNLQFGKDYGQFLACRIVSGVARPPAFGGPAPGADDPVLRNTSLPGCLSPTGRGFLAAAFPGANAAGGTDASQLIGALERLSTVKNVGFNTSNFDQKSRNYAFFTHNIFHITDKLSLTAGLRYTNENKRITASFNNNNTFCPTQQATAGAAIAGSSNATVKTALGGAILFSCLFNSSSGLNNLKLADEKGEDQFTGTAALSFKPHRDWMFYGSYSKGYKAGGFNLDASALGSPTGLIAPGNVSNLRFEPEKVDAYELGFKYGGRQLNLNVAAFRQNFSSFQLNTFNGLFFLVQNVNGCTDLQGTPSPALAAGSFAGTSGADEDSSGATGTCAADNVSSGVRSQGVEIEGAVFPSRDLTITAGFTYADTKYRNDLVGNIAGTLPLAAELFLLPGSNLSNAPKTVVTTSMTWTPRLGTSGLTGLLYVDSRLTGDYNTGSDLFPEKEQDGFATVNARVGLRGPQERWGVELWAQNLFNINYDQVAFNSPLQASGAGTRESVAQFGSPFASQLFSAFLAEPRTYGITGRFRF
ncbi:MAG TPA: TonB-dependent receptor [Allosphingosinicella sp.]|jgi:outer membrane receptor protein involved in Fe transport